MNKSRETQVLRWRHGSMSGRWVGWLAEGYRNSKRASAVKDVVPNPFSAGINVSKQIPGRLGSGVIGLSDEDCNLLCQASSADDDDVLRVTRSPIGAVHRVPVSYTHLTLPTNREV